jgi:hypothetical protein
VGKAEYFIITLNKPVCATIMRSNEVFDITTTAFMKGMKVTLNGNILERECITVLEKIHFLSINVHKRN